MDKPIEVHKTDLEILNELAELHGKLVLFKEIKEGPAHEPTFLIQVRVGDLVGYGWGPTKKKARSHAAKDVLKALSELPPPQGKTPYWCKPHADPLDPEKRKFFLHNKNPINALTEVLKIRKQPAASFKVVNIEDTHDADSMVVYRMEVRVGDLSCHAVAPNKKEAKVMAAKRMLEMMGFKEQLEMQNPPMQPYESQLFQQKVYEEQAVQQRQHQEAVKALRRRLAKEEKQKKLRPEEKSEKLRPEETVEELLRPEDSQLEVLLVQNQEAALTKQASAEETVDMYSEETEETQSVEKGTRSAHLMAAAMIKKLIQKAHKVPDIEQQIRLVRMLRQVETGVRIPEDSQLTDKDLKAVGKAAAKSFLQKCGSPFALSDDSFSEALIRLKLNVQLAYFLVHRRQTEPRRIIRNRIRPGPLRTYLSSPN